MNNSQTREPNNNSMLGVHLQAPTGIAHGLLFLIILSIPWVKLELIGRVALTDILFACLVFVLYAQYTIAQWRLKFQGSPPAFFLFCLSLWVISALASGFNAHHLDAYISDSLGIIYLAVLGLIFALLAAQNEKFLESVLRWLRYSLAIVIIVGFAGVLFTVLTKQYNLFFYSDANKLIATFRFPNQLGGYLVLFLPLLCEEIVKSERAAHRVGYGILLILLLIDLVASGSRSALMAALFAGMVYFAINSIKVNIRLILGASILALIVYVLALVLSNYVEVIQRAFSALHSVILQGQITDEFRLMNWALAFSIFQESPWVGYGVGNVQYDYVFEIHNSYLSVLAEMGIVGVAALLYLVGYIGFTTCQNMRLAHKANSLAWVGTTRAFFVGFLTEAVYLTQHQMLRSRFLWLFFGLVVALNMILKSKGK